MKWRKVDRQGLLDKTNRDPFVRWVMAGEALGLVSKYGWACVGPWRPHGRHWGGAAIVDPDAPEGAESQALALLDQLAMEHGAVLEWFSTAPGRVLQLPATRSMTGIGEWDFHWVDRSGFAQWPTPPPDIEVIELDDEVDAQRLEDFGRSHHPDFKGFPGRGYAMFWAAVRSVRDGELVGIGALHELASGIPHLAGIVVHRQWRGRGVGLTLSAVLTERAILEAGVSTLGVDRENHGAQRIYRRLGYQAAQQFSTRGLAPVATST